MVGRGSVDNDKRVHGVSKRVIETHGNSEQGLLRQGSSVENSFFDDIKQEAALEPRAVWVLWLLCFMVILLIIGVMLSPYDTVPVSNEGWVT